MSFLLCYVEDSRPSCCSYIHTSLWYESKPKMSTNHNATSTRSLQPGGEKDGQATSSVTDKTTSDDMEDDEDEPWGSTTTIAIKNTDNFWKKLSRTIPYLTIEFLAPSYR